MKNQILIRISILGLLLFVTQSASGLDRGCGEILDEIHIDGRFVNAESTEGVLLAISQKYGIKIALFSARTELPTADGVSMVGNSMAYFPMKSNIIPANGTLRSVLRELLAPNYRSKCDAGILTITPEGGVAPEVEEFIGREVVVPDIEKCRACSTSMTFWFEDGTELSDRILQKILAFDIDVPNIVKNVQMQRVSVQAFFYELLRKGKYRYFAVGRLNIRGTHQINLDLVE